MIQGSDEEDRHEYTEIGAANLPNYVSLTTKRYRLLCASQIFFTLAAVGLAVALALVVTQSKKVEEEVVIVPADTSLPFRFPEPYDISQSHTRSLAFTTDETTWTNVDVSPDGTKITFDCLGDIYIVGIDGGEAERVIGGVAFDTQPRFSPDGKSILYKSDASGCDNIWRYDIEAKTSHQVSNESYRFVGSAGWSDDGQHIIAVKWFTSGRSIGAGELWMYPATGEPTTGRQVLGRARNDSQIGPEEPHFDISGHYVYFSLNDADAPSGVWSYSKNPHGTIYAIYRVNVDDQKAEFVTGGPGGACRPQPSHGGEWLAFISRGEWSSQLIIRHILTGNEKILYDNLSTDQQESSAPSGVYPFFDWLPADDAIIIWSRGKILRVEVATGVATEIPISINVDLKLAETVRPSVSAKTPEQVGAKVVQWPALTRNQALLYVYALGYIYEVTLADGAFRRVTSQTTSFEFGPALDPTEKYLVITTWSDTTLGTVAIIDISSGATVATVATTGRYAFASFSSSGDHVIFTRIPAWDSVSGSTHNADLGVFVAKLLFSEDGASIIGSDPARLLVPSASGPATFSHDDAHILSRSGATVRVIDTLTGAVLRTATTGAYATEVAVSPDMRHVAFVELDNVYIAPLPEAGAALSLSSRPRAHPTPSMVRVSAHGGKYLRWSADSDTLSFLLGPMLHVISADKVATCAGTASDDNKYALDCALEHVTYTGLHIAAPSRASNAVVLLRNGHVYTMDDASNNYPNGCVETTGGTITFVGTCDDYDAQDRSPDHERDVEGAVIMPGFVDAHAHWGGSSDFYVRQSWEMLANLAYGVTTLHNPSYETIDAFAEAELALTGEKLSPRLFSTGTILYGADGTYRCEINTDADANEALLRLQSYGAWSAKSYNQPCRSSRLRLLSAARDLNFAVVPEGGMSFSWNLNQIIDGHTTLEHSLPVAPLFNDVLSLFSASGTAYTPTLIVNYGGIWGERYWYQMTDVWEVERLARFTPTAALQSVGMRRVMADDRDYHHFRTAQSVAELGRRGTTVAAGAHGQRHGVGLHWEMWMMTDGGMVPEEVYEAATKGGARALGLRDVGTIEVGMVADVIVYEVGAEPMTDIRDSDNIRYVMMDGHLYEAATMDQILPEFVPLPAGPLLNTPTVTSNQETYCA